MCQKIMQYILNNKKLDWLERKMPNPYAFVWDKVDKIFGLIFLVIFGSLFFFAKEITCPSLILEIFFILFFLSIVRHIKTVPADTEQAITKPLLCYELILVSILLVFGFIQVLNCLNT